MSVKQGFTFEREIISSGKLLGIHIRKIPTSIFSDRKVLGTYDVFSLSGGIFAAMECKELASATAFPFSRVEPHQESDLRDVHLCGGRAYILVNYRVNRTLKLYAIPIYKWMEMKQTLGRKSIPYDMFSQLQEIPDVRKEFNSKTPVWDLRVVFNFQYRSDASVSTCCIEQAGGAGVPGVHRSGSRNDVPRGGSVPADEDVLPTKVRPRRTRIGNLHR